MNKEITFKIWVVKFCLKIIYPKFNYHSFLVYLAVKYRKLHYKKLTYGVSMDPTYKIVPISPHVQRLLTMQHLEDNTAVIMHKCLVISRSQFIDLASENFFYLDNNVLWLSLKLSPRNFKKYKEKQNRNNKDKLNKYNLNFISSEIHKKLWAGKGLGSVEKSRIVPVIGSKHVEENVISTNETETYNIASSFGLNISDIEICLHPVPRLECAPKIAAAAEVSLIVNDYDLSNDFVKEVLNNYFEIPKLIHANDMFSIDLTPEITAQYHYKYLDLVELTGKLYFKCHLTDGNLNENKHNEDMELPFYIVKGVTQLSLGESIHETKPKEEYFKLQESSTNKQLLTICPNGLKNKFDQIQESIVPFLTGNLNELTSSLCSPIIPILLLTGSLGSGRHLLLKALAKYNGLNYLQIDCNALQSSTAKQTESKISSTIQRAKTASPAVVVLDNFEVFAVDPENNEDCRLIEYFENSFSDLYQHYTKHAIIFVAVTDKTDLKPNIQRIFLDKFHIPKLDSKQRCEMLEWFVSVMGLELDNADKIDRHNVDENNSTKDVLQKVAAKTETFKYGDMDTLVHFALRESYLHQQNNTNILLPDLNMNLVREQHFDSALESMRTLQSQHLDAPKIPKVYWEDIGGLEHLKKELLKTIEFPIKYPHLFKNSSLKRSGLLLYGPPGCGKTLVAKAVSTEMNVSFLSVKGPELLNMYIGQSEENVRRVFESARASSPCIIFLDELDSMAARRGAAGDSGGASDRLVSQLLAELDGVTTQDAESTSFVFVIGATNRPDLLEQSLLRPGRLDKLVYVGPYCGGEKTKVLTSLCRKHRLDPGVDLSLVSSALPERCTGADLQQVVGGARASALRTLVASLKDGLIKESDLSADSVVIGEEDIRAGLSAFRPSVTDQELAHYESLRRQM